MTWLLAFLLGLGEAHALEHSELTLPPVVYAVEGIPVAIHFANLVGRERTAGLAFRVEADVGEADETRWQFAPRRRDVGDHALKIELLNESGTRIGFQETRVRVSRANAGQGLSDVKILLVGDSLTDSSLYPEALRKHLVKGDNPPFELVGSNVDHAFPGVAHDGYAGWTWEQFVSRYRDEPYDAAYPQRGSSPFVRKSPNGEVGLDMKSYQLDRLGGKVPSVIVVALGVNDCFGVLVDPASHIEQCIEDMLVNADRLIAAFKSQFPEATIAVSLTQPPNSRFGSFASTYKEKRSRAEYLQIWHRVVQRELAHFGDPKREVALLPIGLGLDTVEGFNPNNALHPNVLGYGQMGDAVYAWLKAELTRREE